MYNTRRCIIHHDNASDTIKLWFIESLNGIHYSICPQGEGKYSKVEFEDGGILPHPTLALSYPIWKLLMETLVNEGWVKPPANDELVNELRADKKFFYNLVETVTQHFLE
jgi:hypothetical protein